MKPSAQRVARRWLAAQDDDDWLQQLLDEPDEPDEPAPAARPTGPPPIPEREIKAKTKAVGDFANRIGNLRNWRLVYTAEPGEFGYYERGASRRTWIIEAPRLDTVLAGEHHDYSTGVLNKWPEILLMHDKSNGNYEVMLVPDPFAKQLRGRYQDAKGMVVSDLVKGQRKALAGLKTWWLKTGTALAQGEPKWVPFRF